MKELFETGLITVFFNFSNYWLSALVYISLFAGFVVQTTILQRLKGTKFRWVYSILLILACIACEILTWTIIGWDRYYLSIVYLGVVGNVIGAVIATMVYWIKQRSFFYKQ